MPDDLRLDDQQTLQAAQELLDRGRPFHAHEVLEARWKAVAGGADRVCWQALAQLAVGLTHAERGNPDGATRLIGRGRQRLASVAADPLPIEAGPVLEWADAWLGGDRRPLQLIGRVGGSS